MADVVQNFLAGRIGILEDGDQRTLEFLSFVESLGLRWASDRKPTENCFTSKNMCMKISDFGLSYGKRLCRDFKNPNFVPMTATEFLEKIDSLESGDFSDFNDMFGE